MLNNEFIATLGSVAYPKKYFDGRGMYLYLQPSGAKYWRLKYRYEGLEKTYAMGTYPRVTLADARQKTDEAKQLLKQGIDPSQFKKNQGFEIVAREWFDNKKEGWKGRHAQVVINSLEQDVFPYIGKRNISAIRPPELLTVIRRIEKRGALRVAEKVLQRMRSVFRYGIQTGRAKSNPASELVGVIKTKKVQHRKALKPEQLPAFIKKVKNYEGMASTRNAILLMLLTFVRTDELRCATWDEINLVDAIWKLPADRTKMEREHIVPLSRQAIELLQAMPSYPYGGYLFRGRKQGKAISSKTMIHALYRMGYKDQATIHGFRSVASTAFNESGLFSKDIIEKQLSHVEGNASRRAYNHAEYLEMMQWWVDYLDKQQGIVSVGFVDRLKGFFYR
jgi:integrase